MARTGPGQRVDSTAAPGGACAAVLRVLLFWCRVAMSISTILAAKRRMTPKKGANLVGVDAFETEPGEELYLISHHPTREAAEEALTARKAKHADEVVYIYGPGDE